MTSDASHDTNGTRSTRPPKASRFMTWMNGQAVKRIRRKGGTFMGMNVLVLNTDGRRTGVERATPVG